MRSLIAILFILMPMTEALASKTVFSAETEGGSCTVVQNGSSFEVHITVNDGHILTIQGPELDTVLLQPGTVVASCGSHTLGMNGKQFLSLLHSPTQVQSLFRKSSATPQDFAPAFSQ